MKKILVISLVFVALSVALTACGFIDLSDLFGRGTDDSDVVGSNDPNTVSNDDRSTENRSDGIYEGQLDENGKFTGWGIWLYHNFRYEGYFVDGLPNGEGVLYRANAEPANLDADSSYAMIIITEGTFVDGYAHGMVRHTWIHNTNSTSIWNIDMNMGYSTIIGEEIWGTVLVEGRPDVSLILSADYLLGVPPFVEGIATNPDIAPPDSMGNLSDSDIFNYANGQHRNDVGEFDIVMAKGFEEREIIFRITMPRLQDLMTHNIPGPDGTSPAGSFINIDLGEGYYILVRLDTFVSNPISSNYDYGHIREYFSDTEIIFSLYISAEHSHDWSSISQIDLSIHGHNGEYYSYSFMKSDIEVSVAEILPGMASFKDFKVDPSAISLSAKDNGNGTMTFTYRDTSIKQNYIYPWEWANNDETSVASLIFRFGVYGVHAGTSLDGRGDGTVAIGSWIDADRRIGNYDWSYKWDWHVVNMEDNLMLRPFLNAYDYINKPSGNHPDGFLAQVDENGLTATWTKEYSSGYDSSDIVGFVVRITQYLSSERSHGHDTLSNYNSNFDQWLLFDVDKVME
ncbi:MAG: hypothetical protein LBD23_06640 [Oscillospiraceae bacterium]|jgi:hypothetical protein|nr:hypothetical protein [Oscillospiraceae bacterium]